MADAFFVSDWTAARPSPAQKATPAGRARGIGEIQGFPMQSGGGDALVGRRRLAQHIAAAPDGFDVIVAIGGGRLELGGLRGEIVRLADVAIRIRRDAGEEFRTIRRRNTDGIDCGSKLAV